MALKKSEKKLLKILGGVAVISGIVLYRTFNPPAPDVVETETTPTAETPAATAATPKSSQPSVSGGSRGGGARGGGGSGGGGNTLPSPEPSGVSLADFQNHNSPRDCWVTIGDDAYDISNYLENNQSVASEIDQYCGTLGFEFGFGQEQSLIIKELKQKAQNLGPLK